MRNNEIYETFLQYICPADKRYIIIFMAHMVLYVRPMDDKAKKMICIEFLHRDTLAICDIKKGILTLKTRYSNTMIYNIITDTIILKDNENDNFVITDIECDDISIAPEFCHTISNINNYCLKFGSITITGNYDLHRKTLYLIICEKRLKCKSIPPELWEFIVAEFMSFDS